MQRFLVFYLAALSISHAQELTDGNCPQVQPMGNFQLTSYLGTWYEVQTYSGPYIVDQYCSVSTYSARNDTSMDVVIKNVNDYDGSIETNRAYVALIQPGVGKLEIFVDSQETNTSYIVVDTDYKNWAAVFGCFYLAENSAHANFASLLTRNRKPDEEHVQAALAAFKSKAVETGRLRAVSQEACDKI